MKIKIIKKGNDSANKDSLFFQPKQIEKKQKLEDKVAQNILGWVSELKEKKQFEIINAQNLLSNYR